jgi:hypothetical protein
MAERREDAVRKRIALDGVVVADLAASDELHNPAKSTVLGAGPHQTLQIYFQWGLWGCEGTEGTYVGINAFVACQRWVSTTGLSLTVDEAGAECCFEA